MILQPYTISILTFPQHPEHGTGTMTTNPKGKSPMDYRAHGSQLLPLHVYSPAQGTGIPAFISIFWAGPGIGLHDLCGSLPSQEGSRVL